VARNSRKGENEGSMDKAKGRVEESADSLSGNKDLKPEEEPIRTRARSRRRAPAKDLLG
jgi:hypothetical protein